MSGKKARGQKDARSPIIFRREDGSPFAFAGLWEFWRSPEGEEVRSCTIITCDANELVKPVHERMPVMLSGDDLWLWLEQDQPGDLLGMLKPYPVDQMECYPVSAMVNRPEVETPELVRPVAV